MKIVLLERVPNLGAIGDVVTVKDGARVTRGQIVLDRPIKTLGVHQVKVQLHPEVEVTVSINIARSQDEAERQAAGEDVIAAQYEDDRAQDAQAASDMLEGGAGQAMQDAY